MEDHKILITTSGLGSRLGCLTDYTNKSLIRIGDKPAISRIIEAYGKESKFVITVGHHGDKVQQFLSLVYPDWNIEIVQVDKYEGPGSSLGYSISLCESLINCPFVFHACDTIVQNFKKPELSDNWLLFCNRSENSNYRTLLIDGGKVIKVKEKGEIGAQSCYLGVAGVKDHQLFFGNLLAYLSQKEDVSDADVVNLMMREVIFNAIEIEESNWFDIGNTTSLSVARKYFRSDNEVLDKKDESIFFHEDAVVKFFSDSKINANRVKRAQILKGFVPDLIGHSDNFYAYKKAEGVVFSKTANPESFRKLLDWSNNCFWTRESIDDGFRNSCLNFYVEKTIQRIKKHLEGREDETRILNGINMPSIYELISKIDQKWLAEGVPSRFHGDFILDNIIQNNDNFVFIDWRQDFQGRLDFGDLYYDVSKLNHNLVVNHEIANKKLYFVEDISVHEKKCDILCSAKLCGLRKILMEFIEDSGLDKKKVELITSLIWLNMSGVHDDDFGKFLFNWGKYNLFLNL